MPCETRAAARIHASTGLCAACAACRNGVYARSIVRGLQSVGITTAIVSGHSDALPLADQDAEGLRLGAAPHALFGVPVPAAKWRCLHTGSGWSEFAAAGDGEALTRSIAATGCSVGFAVDWHAVEFMARLQQTARRLTVASEATASPVAVAQLAALAALPVVYLNFRVYSTSTGLHTNILARDALASACSGESHTGAASATSGGGCVLAASDDDLAACDSTDAAFFRCKEGAAVRRCAMTVALCRQDAVALFALAAGVDPLTGRSFDQRCGVVVTADSPASNTSTPDIRVLLPPLRADIAALAGEPWMAPTDTLTADPAVAGGADVAATATAGRRFLSCVVRISPEKGPLRFAQACAQPELQAAMKEADVVPLLCGAVGDAGELPSGNRQAAPPRVRSHCLYCSCCLTRCCRVRACNQGHASIGVRRGRHRVPCDRFVHGPTGDARGVAAERAVCAPC